MARKKSPNPEQCAKIKMAKLVGVLHDDDDEKPGLKSKSSKNKCEARRQIPLTIDDNLTMVMALDNTCLACCTCNNAVERKNFQEVLRKYEIFSGSGKKENDELAKALLVSISDLNSTLNMEVSCVGCRRAVNDLLKKLLDTDNNCNALMPLILTDNRMISLNKDHICNSQSLANLFSNQILRLRTTYSDSMAETNTRKNIGKSRCPSHSSGLGPTKCLAFGQFNWSDTWNCMERECQEECGQIKFEDLRQTIGTYLKKNKFCEDCGKMVLKAYKMLTDGEWNLHDEDSDECVEEASDTCTCCKGPMYRLKNMLTSCNDQHIHVECKEAVIAHLIGMAEPELSGAKHNGHAKTLEQGQKEVLICIGICLYKRFQKIQQKLQEGQQACDLLFYVALKTLKHSFEMAFESKQGISDLEKLCLEFDEDERKKELKAQKKREKKKKRKEIPGNLVVQKLEKKVANASCQHGVSLLANPNSKNEPMSLLKLASILENQDLSDEDDEEEDISQEEIQQYLKEVSGQREKLRKTLEQRFSQLCIDGLEYENGTYICTKRACTKHDKGGRGG